MADLSDKDAAQTVKLVGTDASGIETNYIDATVNGIKVDGSAVTQPVSGTVTANQGGTWTVRTTAQDGYRTTYSASASGFSLAASATDIFTITGSASTVIRITKLGISGSTTSGSGILANIQVIKRSTANTGGTSVVLTNVSHDSTSSAATAVVRNYTANPTLGTAVGTVRARRYAFESSGVPTNEIVYEFGNGPSQAIVLNGTTQQLCVNFSATTITGGIASICIEWTEE